MRINLRAYGRRLREIWEMADCPIWMIFDLKRGYGITWDLQELNTFVHENADLMLNSDQFYNEEEKHFQKMWQRYFIKTGIESRKNLKLHIQHVPKRYWKYLTEKK